MKFGKFYSSKVDHHILENLDEEYKKNFDILVKESNEGSWSKKQKKVQKASILSNIAFYRTFLEFDVPKEEAVELVRERANHKARKLNNILKKFFRFPKFSKLFRFMMKKTMSGTEIWKIEILENNEKRYVFDVNKCLWADTCAHFGCPELCEVFCLSDHIIFGDINKMEFERSQTLGMNGEKCDFCFKFKK